MYQAPAVHGDTARTTDLKLLGQGYYYEAAISLDKPAAKPSAWTLRFILTSWSAFLWTSLHVSLGNVELRILNTETSHEACGAPRRCGSLVDVWIRCLVGQADFDRRRTHCICLLP